MSCMVPPTEGSKTHTVTVEVLVFFWMRLCSRVITVHMYTKHKPYRNPKTHFHRTLQFVRALEFTVRQPGQAADELPVHVTSVSVIRNSTIRDGPAEMNLFRRLLAQTTKHLSPRCSTKFLLAVLAD